jgi:hypothetical protein
MRTADVAALPVSEIALPDRVLFLWTTAPLLPDHLEVVKAWASRIGQSWYGTNRFSAWAASLVVLVLSFMDSRNTSTKGVNAMFEGSTFGAGVK